MTDLPMTVLGGYLGAGKTTLLNRILAEAQGRRIAVVVNDFGAVNVDADLLHSSDEDTIELSNGCICCSLPDGMAQVMDRLRAVRNRLDHVVVEVSGVGDPGAVAAWADHPGFRRGGVVVCADVLQIQDLAADRWVADTVLGQLRSADTVLLTKTDLAEADLASRVRGWVAGVAPEARILEGGVDTASLLDTEGDSGKSAGFGHDGCHSDAHVSWSLTGAGVVASAALEDVLLGAPREVVRIKGVLRTTAAPDRRTVVQVTGGRLEVRDDGPWTTPDRASTLVVVARGSGQPASAALSYVAAVEGELGLVQLGD